MHSFFNKRSTPVPLPITVEGPLKCGVCVYYKSATCSNGSAALLKAIYEDL